MVPEISAASCSLSGSAACLDLVFDLVGSESLVIQNLTDLAAIELEPRVSEVTEGDDRS